MSDVWTDEVDWQSIEASFCPPHELRSPPPRRVVPRDSAESGFRARVERGCLAGCLVPIFLLGLLLLYWGGLAALILPLGTTTTGVVTQRERGNARDSTQSLRFRFQVQGQPHNGQGQVPTEKWQRVQVGDTIRVRYFPFAPGLRPLLADDFSPWNSIFGLGVLGLLMVAVSALPLAGTLTGRQGKRSVRDGICTPALVVEHDTAKGQITALIRTPDGRAVEIKERPKDLSSYKVGQVETALYPQAKPHKARLYRTLDWTADSTQEH